MRKHALSLRAKQSVTGAAFALPAAAGFAACFLLPLAVSLYYAFAGAGGPTLGNFRAVLASPAFRTAFGNTFLQLGLCLALLLVLSLFAALGLVYLKKSRDKLVFFLLAILLLPMAVPSSVAAVFVQDVFGGSGIFNGLRVQAHLAPVNFFGTDASFFLLVGIFLWRNIGLSTLLFYARIDAAPEDILDAARLDSANAVQRTRYIVLPELGQAFLFVCVVGVWGVFSLSRESRLLFGAYPASAVYGLQNFLANHFRSANYAALSAASAIFLAAVSVLLLGALALGKERDHA